MRFRNFLSLLLSAQILLFSCGAPASAGNNWQLTAAQSAAKNPAEKVLKDIGDALTLGTQLVIPKVKNTPLIEPYLIAGNLPAAEAAASAELKRRPKDDNTRFALGITQYLQAIEQLGQDFHHYGLKDMEVHHFNIPILRLPVPKATNPSILTYEGARGIAQKLADNLAKADETLAGITDGNVRVPLHFGMIRFDLNHDGKADDSEYLWRMYARLSRNSNLKPETAAKFVICFDRADVHWMRGYCHLLSALCEVYLAYDTKETFDSTAHVFFSNVQSPYKFLARESTSHTRQRDFEVIVDLVAIIHMIRWSCAEPQRMTAALNHLQTCVDQGKQTWKWIMSETDDDREWIPSPSQTGVIPNVRVTQEMVTAWMKMLDQLDQILKGDLLIPFWRGETGSGINLRRVFVEPRTFDLVLWVQGSAAAPYLQSGKLAEGEFWHDLQVTFNHNFIGFAVWFN